jgi:alpha-tubulin suppressor-like RCC1 family protein
MLTKLCSTQRVVSFLDEKGIVGISCGLWHCATVSASQGVCYLWGRNQCGQLGRGETTPKNKRTKATTTVDESLDPGSHEHQIDVVPALALLRAYGGQILRNTSLFSACYT